MQLGHCRFDSDKGELINQESGLVWSLPRAELHVLRLLVEYQGKVVAKPILESGHKDGSHLSSASVARAIFTLRSFLGPQHETLIETVKGQGYLLRHHRARKETRYQRRRFTIKSLPVLLVVISLFSVLLLSLWWFNRLGPSISPTMPLSIDTVTLDSGQQVEMILYSPSNTNNELLIAQGQLLTQSLLHCHETVWNKVFLSLSHDKQVLNITFRGDYFGQSIIRNIKISDLRQPKRFINPEWLKQVSICDSSPVQIASSHQSWRR